MNIDDYNVTIPQAVTFDLPEGNYRATITDIKLFPQQCKGEARKMVRIFFKVHIPSMKKFDTRAARTFRYDLRDGSELRNWLTPLLGEDFFTEMSGQEFNIKTLTQMEYDVSLEHYQGPKYDKPMVIVRGVYPSGTLELTEKYEPEPEKDANNKEVACY